MEKIIEYDIINVTKKIHDTIFTSFDHEVSERIIFSFSLRQLLSTMFVFSRLCTSTLERDSVPSDLL